ncbi:uncharacterized protein A4U43_C07F26680 [Asparagus officinalis]|uniref:Pre-mRNA-processing factor 17 n=1 Tax=Asparagus officinalis TaxID=4686 RepID=A0A5P1EF48_ASPOF|nr:uncharacterized protein A4U43_C07F26680 [Asparagus officinalis]
MDLLRSYSHLSDDDEEEDEAEPHPDKAHHNLLRAKSAAPRVLRPTLTLAPPSNPTARLAGPIDPSQHSSPAFNPTYAPGLRPAPAAGPCLSPYRRRPQDASVNKARFVEDGLHPNLSLRRAVQKPCQMSVMPADPSASYAAESDCSAVRESACEWVLKNKKSPWSGKKEVAQGELTEEQKKYAEEYAQKKADKEKDGKGERPEHNDKSTFHGKEQVDYQGRSWIQPPKDAKPANDHCYIPKRKIHTWSGHEKAVSAIRFFPRHGHLLLSAGMDNKVKIWDVFNSGKCMRTYMGHSKAVRDISFSNDGSRFLSAGYDKNIKLWDTETGKVLSTFSTGKIPYVVKLNPDEDKQHILLAGMSDKKIVQWDMNSGEITQEYDQHLGAVNTITFVDNNRRFVTSSDDKSLRVWEFGIPVVIKYISEPHMHSMPSISLHPNSNWLAAQSLDNQILIYSTKERFQLNKKKRFAGHIVAGYACQVNFSPDGRFVMSGDGEGKCWFWDWKSCKVFKTLKCHNGVCIGCEWHPLEQSKVATCGWDGMIHYW